MNYTNTLTLTNLLTAKDTVGLIKLSEAKVKEQFKDKQESYRFRVRSFYANDTNTNETCLYILDDNTRTLYRYKLECKENEFGIGNLQTTEAKDIDVTLQQTVTVDESNLKEISRSLFLFKYLLNVFIVPTIEVTPQDNGEATLLVSYKNFIFSSKVDEDVEKIKNMSTLVVNDEDTIVTTFAKLIKEVDYLSYYIEPSKDKVLEGLTVTIGHHPEDQTDDDITKLEYTISIGNSFAQNIYTETQKLCISGEKEDNHLLRCEVFEDDSVDVAANRLAKFLLHNVWTILNWSEDEWTTFANNFKELTGSSKFYEALGEPLTEVVLINRLYSKLSGFID